MENFVNPHKEAELIRAICTFALVWIWAFFFFPIGNLCNGEIPIPDLMTGQLFTIMAAVTYEMGTGGLTIKIK